VSRQPYTGKLHGVFLVSKQQEHALVANIEDVWPVPHSRWNTLSAATLRAGGYQILSESGEVGADVFVKNFGNSLFIFLQGHPEYDARALMREYRRDVLRYISGERHDYPPMPAYYFDILTQRRLTEFRDCVLADRAYDQGMVEFQVVVGKANLDATWKPAAVQLYRNWFGILAAQRQKPLTQAAL
jgi:homoserine O-succinyltransferase